MENIRYLAEIVTKNIIYSVRGGDNAACKLGRQICGSDNIFWDIWNIHYGTFQIVLKKNTELFSKNGTEVHGSLFKLDKNRWEKQENFHISRSQKEIWMKHYMDETVMLTKNYNKMN